MTTHIVTKNLHPPNDWRAKNDALRTMFIDTTLDGEEFEYVESFYKRHSLHYLLAIMEYNKRKPNVKLIITHEAPYYSAHKNKYLINKECNGLWLAKINADEDMEEF